MRESSLEFKEAVQKSEWASAFQMLSTQDPVWRPSVRASQSLEEKRTAEFTNMVSIDIWITQIFPRLSNQERGRLAQVCWQFYHVNKTLFDLYPEFPDEAHASDKLSLIDKQAQNLYPNKLIRQFFIMVGKGDLSGLRQLQEEQPEAFEMCKNFRRSDDYTLTRLAQRHDDIRILLFLASQGFDISNEISINSLEVTARHGLKNVCRLICIIHNSVLSESRVKNLEDIIRQACEHKQSEIVEQLIFYYPYGNVLNLASLVDVVVEKNDPRTFAVVLRAGQKMQKETKSIFTKFLREDKLIEICKQDQAELLRLVFDPEIGQFTIAERSAHTIFGSACDARAASVVKEFWPDVRDIGRTGGFGEDKFIDTITVKKHLVPFLADILQVNPQQVSEEDLHKTLQVCDRIGRFSDDLTWSLILHYMRSSVYKFGTLEWASTPVGKFLEAILRVDSNHFSKRNHAYFVRLSARFGDLDMLKGFIQFSDPLLQHGATLLSEACYRGDIDIIKYLLDLGLKVEVDAVIAVIQGFYEFNNRPCTQKSERRSKYFEIIHILLERVDDPNRQDASGNLISVAAVDFEDPYDSDCTLLNSLMDKLSVNAQDGRGNTALHRACMLKHEPAIKLLLDKGARLNIQNSKGDTPANLLFYRGLDSSFQKDLFVQEVLQNPIYREAGYPDFPHEFFCSDFLESNIDRVDEDVLNLMFNKHPKLVVRFHLLGRALNQCEELIEEKCRDSHWQLGKLGSVHKIFVPKKGFGRYKTTVEKYEVPKTIRAVYELIIDTKARVVVMPIDEQIRTLSSLCEDIIKLLEASMNQGKRTFDFFESLDGRSQDTTHSYQTMLNILLTARDCWAEQKHKAESVNSNETLLRLDQENADKYFDFWLKTYQHPEVNAFFFKPMSMPKENMRALYDAYVKNSNVHFFIFLDAKKEAVGTCRVTFFNGARSHTAMINAFAIHPAVHRNGYGSKMLASVEHYIKSLPRKVTQIELAYEGDNEVGRKFYEEKFAYQLKINYEDWWRRSETEFQKEYPWYTEERCCVKYLSEASMHLPAPIPIVRPLQIYSENQNLLRYDYSKHEIDYLLSTYSREERNEIHNILSEKNYTIYTLRDQSSVVALISFKKYDETRLQHAVTLPCIIFDETISNIDVANFVDASLKKYRMENPQVFHFACSEEDTEDLFYTNGHSKIARLSSILQLAGFKFKGTFQNYFDESSPVGRDLLGFECCFLTLNNALECVNLSKLTIVEKEKLRSALGELLKDQDKFSRHEQWDIYRLVRYVAYPQDYTSDQIKLRIEASNSDCVELKEILLEIAYKTQSPPRQRSFFKAEIKSTSIEIFPLAEKMEPF